MSDTTSSNHLLKGAKGELIAQEMLRKKGMTILHTNWRHKRDEVDIIAEEDRFVVFVEVKTRSTSAFGDPETWVDVTKQKKMMRAAQAYIEENGTERELRFDIVSVVLSKDQEEVFHIPHAFYPTVQ